jgi:DNA processing protein
MTRAFRPVVTDYVSPYNGREEVELGCRSEEFYVELADLIALSRISTSRRRIVDAARLADTIDGRFDTALEVLGAREDAVALRRHAEAALSDAARSRLTPIAWDSPEFPALLAAIADPPLVLWVRGEPESLSHPAVAIVGSRAASQAAREIARELAAGLARAGLTVVSGLARGCDGAAHQGALDGGGRTVAVLGSGVDVIYPAEHDRLAADITSRGAVISEFPPATPPLPHHVPQRNRIIAGLSHAVVVVEAHERSGSLITAACALEQNREVMVVPGSVRSGRNRGAHALLRDGAALVENAADIIAALPWGAAVQAAASQRPPRGDSAACDGTPHDPLLAVLDPDDGQDLDELQAVTGLDVSELTRRLSELELAGRATRQPGGRFVRSSGKVIT